MHTPPGSPNAMLRIYSKLVSTINDVPQYQIDKMEFAELFTYKTIDNPQGCVVGVASDIVSDGLAQGFVTVKKDLAGQITHISIAWARFKVIEYQMFRDAYICTFDSMLGSWAMWRYKLHWYLSRFAQRLIVTAGIWGLAKPLRCGDYAQIPSWRDVYALNWLNKKLSKLKR